MSVWSARLELGFQRRERKTLLAERRQEGPLVVQKALYPEGDEICHAIVVHPPGGIAGGDELELRATVADGAHALLTAPGAAKWYRSAGAGARQTLHFPVEGVLEWLPRETIVFNGARARLECTVALKNDARYIGWEVLCLGRSGAGERFTDGYVEMQTTVARDGRLLWLERGRIDGGAKLMASPAGLGGHSVCATLIASGGVDADLVAACRKAGGERVALTLLDDVLVARYLGDSSEEAMRAFTVLWSVLRPNLAGREAVEPRIWRT
jgi:urease accessory protein